MTPPGIPLSPYQKLILSALGFPPIERFPFGQPDEPGWITGDGLKIVITGAPNTGDVKRLFEAAGYCWSPISKEWTGQFETERQMKLCLAVAWCAENRHLSSADFPLTIRTRID